MVGYLLYIGHAMGGQQHDGILPQPADPVAEAEKLDDMMVEGRVGQLVVAGISFGSYTIRKLDQDWRYMARSADGPLAVNLSIEFREYY